ncbi:DUF3325 domain-containing protein [Bradyrhizobium prioriisuperbiae]|uniref:DUF3325 domain-containing protein n=1 Tax=Bradyrhizobium prioriisuperbiae TaxID=2854389 RepID=UPI0028E458DF|nr:DUF3325 domain-containing protein [Bradyrhizobium prioritasuperba]
MRDLLFVTGLSAIVYCGFMSLALSQAKHWTRMVETSRCPPHVARRLRIMGWLALAATFAMSVSHDGASFGVLLWSCLISVAAIAVALTLASRPGWFGMVVAILRRIEPAPRGDL